MPDKRDHRYFFVHIMKTAGGTFRRHIKANFEPSEIYPWREAEPDLMAANTEISQLLGLSPERMSQVSVFMGHFPYAVTEELGLDLVTMTILRDPVDRTLSYLRHAILRHEEHRGMTPEEVYEDPYLRPLYMDNHQTKIFSLGPSDRFETYLEAITIDERRLELAKKKLAEVDVLGLTERFGDFLDTLARDYGWALTDVPDRHVSDEDFTVSDSFVERIREDNAMDIALYDYGVGLVEKRSAMSPR